MNVHENGPHITAIYSSYPARSMASMPSFFRNDMYIYFFSHSLLEYAQHYLFQNILQECTVYNIQIQKYGQNCRKATSQLWRLPYLSVVLKWIMLLNRRTQKWRQPTASLWFILVIPELCEEAEAMAGLSRWSRKDHQFRSTKRRILQKSQMY